MNNIPPEGYTPFPFKDGYIGHNGPFFFAQQEDESYRYGFKTDERHANPNNVIHGAALVGFIDTVFGHHIVQTTGRLCATISLTTEFISSAETGSWIETKVNQKRVTGSMAFLNAEILFEDKILMSATSVFKLFKDRK